MEISKKDIKCKEIIERIERLTSSVRKFIQLVNQNLPTGRKLNKEIFIIQREDYHSFMNDGNTQCPGFSYKVYWCYTSKIESTTTENITKLSQQNAVTFLLDCGERCYDHMQNRSYFFSLYCKFNNSEDEAERIDYINDNYDDNHLFKPYEIMQVVWRIKKALNLNPSNVSENVKDFEKFAENFKDVEVEMQFERTHYQLEKQLPTEVINNIFEFQEKANRFVTIVNCYTAYCFGNVALEDLKKFLNYLKHGDCINEEITTALILAIEDFLSDSFIDSAIYEFFPKSFLIYKDSHNTTNYNERQISFSLYDCIKCIVGYSYFNKYVHLQGVAQNWHPRLMYFSYYISEDFQESHYTISLTSCEGRFRENYMQIIEATTIDELLSPQNAIKIAKWLEEIWSKTKLIYYYSSQIERKKIRNFNSTCDID